MTPTLGDLQAYRIWNQSYSVLVEMDRRGSLLALPNEVYQKYHAIPAHHPTNILDVMRLIRTMLPNERTPALDYVWKTKGMAAAQADIAAYWEIDRQKPSSIEDDLLRLNQSRGEEDIRVQLRELKQLVLLTASHSGSRPGATDLTTWLDEQSGRSETATLRSATDNMSTYRK